MFNNSQNIIFLIFSNKYRRLGRLHQGCFLFPLQGAAVVTCSLPFHRRLGRLHQGCFLFPLQEAAVVTCSLPLHCRFLTVRCLTSAPFAATHSLFSFSLHFIYIYIYYHISYIYIYTIKIKTLPLTRLSDLLIDS